MRDGLDEIGDLLETVEEIRSRDFGELDTELVGAIVEVQRQHAEDRAEARKLTEQLINQWVGQQPIPEEDA